MAVSSGNFTVPAEIRALEPDNVPCIVKKTGASNCVYEDYRIPDPDRPCKTKSGRVFGKIDGGVFVPSNSFDYSFPAGIKHPEKQPKDYGEYAFAINFTQHIPARLRSFFEAEDGAVFICRIFIRISHIADSLHPVPLHYGSQKKLLNHSAAPVQGRILSSISLLILASLWHTTQDLSMTPISPVGVRSGYRVPSFVYRENAFFFPCRFSR